jgi:cellulose synthase/poly-beta-1,6-N-acetylglucosamine synthase-like glycosyltransferase
MGEQYAIVTPAYNEASRIARTIESVIRQTTLPIRWVIVDDGSTDGTAAAIESYARTHSFIRHVRRQRAKDDAYFASNVYAIMEGVRHIRNLGYKFLAVLDADIVLPPDYYERILQQFQADPHLGVASGIYENLVNGRLQKVLNDRRSTPKAIQVFRRACFEQIGGYVPLIHGGEDTCACVMARMHGWTAWSFPELKAVHQRPAGIRHAHGLLRTRFRQGLCEYGLSTHPLFMVAKSLRRCLLEPPLLVGGILRLGGYLYGYLKREPCQIPSEVAAYARQEQINRVLYFNHISPRDRVRTGST